MACTWVMGLACTHVGQAIGEHGHLCLSCNITGWTRHSAAAFLRTGALHVCLPYNASRRAPATRPALAPAARPLLVGAQDPRGRLGPAPHGRRRSGHRGRHARHLARGPRGGGRAPLGTRAGPDRGCDAAGGVGGSLGRRRRPAHCGRGAAGGGRRSCDSQGGVTPPLSPPSCRDTSRGSARLCWHGRGVRLASAGLEVAPRRWECGDGCGGDRSGASRIGCTGAAAGDQRCCSWRRECGVYHGQRRRRRRRRSGSCGAYVRRSDARVARVARPGGHVHRTAGCCGVGKCSGRGASGCCSDSGRQRLPRRLVASSFRKGRAWHSSMVAVASRTRRAKSGCLQCVGRPAGSACVGGRGAGGGVRGAGRVHSARRDRDGSAASRVLKAQVIVGANIHQLQQRGSQHKGPPHLQRRSDARRSRTWPFKWLHGCSRGINCDM